MLIATSLLWHVERVKRFMALQKDFRLKKREDFGKVYRHGKSSANQQFVIYVMPNAGTDSFRMGVSASKKLGNAVVRNRVRRLVKEIVRHHADKLAAGKDFIVIVRKPAVDMAYEAMEKSLLHALRRASLLASDSSARPQAEKR